MDDDLEAALDSLPHGWSGTFLRVVGSTQDVARAAANSGAPSASIFVADFQSAGRGRHGRTWLAPPGTALLMSILLRERLATHIRARRATTLASVALAEAVEKLAPMLRAEIKWPNDLMLGGRKVAGVLAESFSQGESQTTIVGVGVNVSQDARALPALATSISVEAGERIRRGVLLVAFIERFEGWLEQPPAALHSAWESRLWRRNQRIRLADGDSTIDATVLGAEEDGALLVRLADGSVQRTFTGEVLA
ncbi:MAG: biotin--[acetyl-CoA-carboxylase] ligase [Chloroflexi bacterium]|nr:biotin--[acetyl-CoA-carboxylase] ligase [Chloroflexota bacterium]